MEEKKTTIRAEDYETYYIYVCPHCGQKIMTLLKAYSGDWIRCNHCLKNIKVI